MRITSSTCPAAVSGKVHFAFPICHKRTSAPKTSDMRRWRRTLAPGAYQTGAFIAIRFWSTFFLLVYSAIVNKQCCPLFRPQYCLYPSPARAGFGNWRLWFNGVGKPSKRRPKQQTTICQALLTQSISVSRVQDSRPFAKPGDGH